MSRQAQQIARTKMLNGSAFALAELLLALCCVAVVLTPFILYLREAGMLQHESAERGRVLAWGAYQRQVVGQGIDPSKAGHFSQEHPLLRGRDLEAVSRSEGVSRGAAGRVVVLSNAVGATGAEMSLGGAGLELFSGEPEQAVVAPLKGAQVFTMLPPAVRPVSGTRLVVQHLGGGGLKLVMGSSEGGRIVLELRQPALRSTGEGTLEVLVSAAAVAKGLVGEMWVEYPGRASVLQQEVALPDGRKAWYVEAAGTVDRYMPSERIPIVYTLDLGAPILMFGTVAYESGATIGVDFRAVQQLRSGKLAMRIQWPDTVLALLAAGPGDLNAFEVNFQAQAAENDTLGADVFGEEKLGLWTSRSVLSARPFVPAGCQAAEGEWQFERQVIALPQPERELAPLVEETPEQPGLFGFQAGDLQGLGRVGRLSARAGQVLGTGAHLNLEVFP